MCLCILVCVVYGEVMEQTIRSTFSMGRKFKNSDFFFGLFFTFFLSSGLAEKNLKLYPPVYRFLSQ